MIYLCCFAVSIFFAHLASRNKGFALVFYSVISILVPSILGGLRHISIGTDTAGYGINCFNTALRSSSYLDFMSRIKTEPGFGLLCYLSASIFGSFNWTLFFYQLITITCVYIGAYRHKETVSMPMLLMCFYLLHYNSSYNLIRQSLAASIIFMGFNHLEAKHYSKFMMYIAAATLFHYSAFMSLFLLVGMYCITTSDVIKHMRHLKMIISYGMVLAFVFARPVMQLIISSVPFLFKYSFYFDQLSSYNSIKSDIAMFAGEMLIFVLYAGNANKVFPFRNESSFFMFNVMFCIAYQVFIRLMPRILLYNQFANLIALASLPHFVRDKYLRLLLGMAVSATVLFWWYYNIVINGVAATYPYVSIL